MVIKNIKILILLLIFAVALPQSTQAQRKPKEECNYACGLDLKYDLIIAGTGGVVGLTGFIMSQRQIALTEQKVLGFSRFNVNRFDRSAIGRDSPAAGTASDVFLFSSMVTPLLLMASRDVRVSWKEYSVMLAETYLLTAGFTILVKELADRPRPFLYDDSVPLDDKVGSFQDNSFFSGHTSLVAASTFFTASIFAFYHPDSKLKPLVWSFAAATPAVVGFLRYWDGKHFFTDILTGYAFGAVIGAMVPFIHRKIQLKIERNNSTGFVKMF